MIKKNGSTEERGKGHQKGSPPDGVTTNPTTDTAGAPADAGSQRAQHSVEEAPTVCISHHSRAEETSVFRLESQSDWSSRRVVPPL